MSVDPRLTVEVNTGGSGLRPSDWTIMAHAFAAVYFVVWSVLDGVLLHWPASMNAWVLAIVAAGTGFAASAVVLAAASSFSTRNVASNLDARGQHYMSGLIHVKIVVKSSLIFFFAIVTAAVLKLAFLAINETCCTWSGVETSRFVATYLLSIFLYQLGTAAAIELLYTDYRPVFQVPNVFGKSAD
jgi:hypothetical protein